MSDEKTRRKRRHHHGNLRPALIRAGIDLIREGGPEALSIRGVAAKVGVSHAAPAHHFKHLADLRAAVIAEAYRRFSASMEGEISRAPDQPQAVLTAAGRGYIAFALDNPGLFHLMFGGVHDTPITDELREAADASYDVLRRISAPLAPGPAGPEGNEILVWSIVHGFASLALTQLGSDPRAADPLELFTRIFPALPLAQP